jgi:tRNA(fMet)-specific endonuclease VapC
MQWGAWQRREVVCEAAQIRCELARKGMPIGHHDTLIAAHARSLDVTLVTHNTRELGRVDGLRIENWALDTGEGAQP